MKSLKIKELRKNVDSIIVFTASNYLGWPLMPQILRDGL